ncbi:MAG: transporter [Caldisericum exile]|uniref:Transporter n=1 Tax=Caldisericum exile TaxID=693075 RepID=A0A2J6X5D7_9BACT|nr:MAG: transporter [Caldisericum exile]
MKFQKTTLISLIRSSIIAGLYFALTVFLAPISFGAIQIRISEALVVLPYSFPEAIFGVTLGCFLSNLFSPFGPIDWVFGTFLTLISALFTYLIGKKKLKKYLAPLPPIIFNALGVSFYVVTLATLNTKLGLIDAFKYSFEHFARKPYLFGVLTIGIGEAISTYLLGLPLLYALERRLKE